MHKCIYLYIYHIYNYIYAIYIYAIYIYTYTQSPDPSSASTFSLSPAHSTSAQGPGIGAAIRPRGTTRYNSDRWTTIDVYTRYIYIYMCIYTYNIVPYLAIPMCKQCKRSQEPHRCILVPLHDVVSPAKSLSIETCWSQDVAHAHLYMKTAKQNQKFVDSKWSKFI